MAYRVSYTCISDIGRCRSMNQDNFICESEIMHAEEERKVCRSSFIAGQNGYVPMLGVFDGMGGEARGEMASYMAACSFLAGGEGMDMTDFCYRANQEISHYASDHKTGTMGTTAAVLQFTEEKLYLCNIGDSKVYRFHDGNLQQISRDHVAPSSFEAKPGLFQFLGLPEEEGLIEPYMAEGYYRNGDIYLVSTDGLTDMLSENEILNILVEHPGADAAERLLIEALDHGGRDNITVIVCVITEEKENVSLWNRILHRIVGAGRDGK